MADFLQAYSQAVIASSEPHLAPVNGASIASDFALIQQRATSLQSYQTFLAAARTAKAERKGAAGFFERSVALQAGQAVDDARTTAAAALRIMQQVNQTSFWTRTMGRMRTALGATGPVTAQQIWNDVWVNQSDPQIRAALQAKGMTDAVSQFVTNGMAQVNASLFLQNGKLAIESRSSAGAASIVTVLRDPGAPPQTVSELLAASRFDQVVSALGNDEPIYLEAVPGSGAVEPAHIFAAGAIAARQVVAEHWRKLQDTGLATQAGNDPLTAALVTLLVAGLVIGAIGVVILVECDNAQNAGQQPPGGKTLCAVGEILVYLAFMILEITFLLAPGGGAIEAIAWLGMGGLLGELVANISQLMPTFHVNPAPGGS